MKWKKPRKQEQLNEKCIYRRLSSTVEKTKFCRNLKIIYLCWSSDGIMIGADIWVVELMGVESLTSGAPNEVCRRKRDPNTRLFLESSEFLDAKDPVLEFMFTFELKFFLSYGNSEGNFVLNGFEMKLKKSNQRMRSLRRNHIQGRTSSFTILLVIGSESYWQKA